MKGAIIKMKKGRKTKIYRTFRLPSFAGGLPALAITVILTASLLFGVGGTKLALISAGLAMPEGGIEYIKTKKVGLMFWDYGGDNDSELISVIIDNTKGEEYDKERKI